MEHYYKHDCILAHEQTIDIFKEIIDAGIFIDWRRKWYTFCVIHPSHPETALYYTSVTAVRREIIRHMIVFRNMIHPFSLLA